MKYFFLIITNCIKSILILFACRFTKDIKSLAITQPLHKVVQNRIYSIVIHPSETSLVIAAGDISGNIGNIYYIIFIIFNQRYKAIEKILIFAGFFSKNHSDMRQYRIHNAPVNCMSFCSWDPFKMMSSSHDGTVRYGDLAKQTFDEVSEIQNYIPISIFRLLNFKFITLIIT